MVRILLEFFLVIFIIIFQLEISDISIFYIVLVNSNISGMAIAALPKYIMMTDDDFPVPTYKERKWSLPLPSHYLLCIYEKKV